MQIPIFPDDSVVEISDLNTNSYSSSVQIGKRLVIKLKGNIDSGFGWYYTDPINRKNCLIPSNLNSFKCGNFINDVDQEGRIINDGFYYFIFKPRKEGKITLNFAYRRPFQWMSPKNMHFKLNVRVNRDYFAENRNQKDCYGKKIFKNYNRKSCSPSKSNFVFQIPKHKFRKCNLAYVTDDDWDCDL